MKQENPRNLFAKSAIAVVFFLLQILQQHLSELEYLKEESLPLLIKTTIHMLEMEAQRQQSIGDAQEDLVHRMLK